MPYCVSARLGGICGMQKARKQIMQSVEIRV